tara:strand:- start:1745 stop:2134 length:390 start_codon:yes stop_codon:yes gene_type:complete
MTSYIGNQPASGQFNKLDSLTFNGSTATFNLTSGGTTVNAGSATQLIISINGVIQEPITTYTVAAGGSQITFTTPPASGANFFGILLGGVGNEASTVADGSITADKVSATFQNTYAKKGTAIALSIALG